MGLWKDPELSLEKIEKEHLFEYYSEENLHLKHFVFLVSFLRLVDEQNQNYSH